MTNWLSVCLSFWLNVVSVRLWLSGHSFIEAGVSGEISCKQQSVSIILLLLRFLISKQSMIRSKASQSASRSNWLTLNQPGRMAWRHKTGQRSQLTSKMFGCYLICMFWLWVKTLFIVFIQSTSIQLFHFIQLNWIELF